MVFVCYFNGFLGDSPPFSIPTVRKEASKMQVQHGRRMAGMMHDGWLDNGPFAVLAHACTHPAVTCDKNKANSDSRKRL